MAKEASRISTKTVLAFGLATAPIALFKTTGDLDRPKFEKAGPHGEPLEHGPIKNGQRLREGVATPTPGTPRPDVADDPFDDAPVSAILRDEDKTAEEEAVSVGLLERGHDDALTEEEVCKGVVVGEGDARRFIDMTEELKKIDEASALDEMRIIAFVRREKVPRDRITGSYYVGTDGDAVAPKLLRLLWEAMRQTERVAVVKWTKRSGQCLGVVTPLGTKALVVLELAWAEQTRTPSKRALSHLAAEVRLGEVAAAVEFAMTLADSGSVIDEQIEDRARMEREAVGLAHLGELDSFGVPERPETFTDADLEELLKRSVVSASRSAGS